MLKGTPVSPGIAIGTAYVIPRQSIHIDGNLLESERTEEEIQRLKRAVAKTVEQLKAICQKAESDKNENAVEIIDSQITILYDAELFKEITDTIRQEHLQAEYALERIFRQYTAKFENIEDPYLQERAADISDAGRRLLSNLLGTPELDLSHLPTGCIVLAYELTPSQTAQFPRGRVAGICVEVGGKSSHVAIMAKSLGIPAVVGLTNIDCLFQTGDLMILDAQSGEIFSNPTPKQLDEYAVRRDDYLSYIQNLRTLLPLDAVTGDGQQKVHLRANIGSPEEVDIAKENGAEGVGLYRSEFLYMNCRSFPSEEEQFAAYRHAAESMAPYPVAIRTLDIGGDKSLPYLQFPEESNPFLGWRAIRLCLDTPDLFLTQLRAILRASNYGNVRLIYPMVSCCEELAAANRWLEVAKSELRQDGIIFDEQIQVGAMIEVPSAAICIGSLLEMVDFVCLGTNDLIQYTMAADRLNEKVSHIYQPLHPAILRLIRHVIEAAHLAGKPVSICGEMAGSVTAVPLLLGMGLTELSMSPGAILHVKRVVRNCRVEEVAALADWAVKQHTANAIHERMQVFLDEFNK